MEKFSSFFGLKLSHFLFAATEQVSITLQGQDTTIQEAVNAAKLTLKFLQNQKNDTKFEEFYSKIVEMSKGIIDEPTLPLCRK